MPFYLNVIGHKMLESVTIQACKPVSFSIAEFPIVDSIPYMDRKSLANTFKTGQVKVTPTGRTFSIWPVTVLLPKLTIICITE